MSALAAYLDKVPLPAGATLIFKDDEPGQSEANTSALRKYHLPPDPTSVMKSAGLGACTRPVTTPSVSTPAVSSCPEGQVATRGRRWRVLDRAIVNT